MKRAVATWSGGKDSCLATYLAIQEGYDLIALANTISSDYLRVRFHGVKAELIQLQAKAIGLPLLQKPTSPDTYREEFLENIKQASEFETLVFGDIHLQDCFDWADQICKELHISLFEPLWQMPQKKILQRCIDAGFEAVVVSTQANLLGKDWIGRKIDKAFIRDITKLPDIDPCGENGEYHTLVIDGPIFQKRLQLDTNEPVLRNGYWFLDITDGTCKRRSPPRPRQQSIISS